MFAPANLRFNYRDLLQAPRRALKGKQIFTQLRGLILGYPIYFALTYAALLLSGQSLASSWDRYGLYPFFMHPGSVLAGLSAWLVFIAGIAAFVAVILVAGAAGSRIAYRELKGDPFYGMGDGWNFAWRHWRAVVLSPITLVAIIVFFLGGAVVLGLLGKLPVVGELIFIGLFPLIIAGAVFTLVTVVVVMMLLAYAPAIVASWEDDAIGTAFQAFAATWHEPLRAFFYTIGVKLLAVIAMLLFGGAITAGYHFVAAVFGSPWLMGDKLAQILGWAEQIVFSGYHHWFLYIPGNLASTAALTAGVDMASISGWGAFAGSLLALVLLLVYSSAIAYGLAVVTVGQTLAFLILKLRMDGENLLERVDSEGPVADAGDDPVQSAGPGSAPEKKSED